MLKRKTNHKPLAPTVGDAREEVKKAAWRYLYKHGLVSEYMTFSSDEKLTEWNRPEQLKLQELHVSTRPFDGIDPSTTRLPEAMSTPVHVALADQNGDLYALSTLNVGQIGKSMRGILTTDRNGQLWLCEASPDGTMTGDGKLRRMSEKTSPLMAYCHESEGTPFSLTAETGMGTMRVIRENIINIGDDYTPRSKMTVCQETSLAMAMANIEQRLDEINARQDKITGIVDRYFTVEAMSRLVPDMTAPIVDGLMPPYNDFERRKVYDDAIDDLTMGFMNELRQAGLCAPCPNNGPREVPSMTAWNAWLNGDFDDDDLPFDRQMLKRYLMNAPAFDQVGVTFMRASMEVEDRIRHELRPGGSASSRNKNPVTIPAERIPEIFALARDVIRDSFEREEDRILIMRSENLRSSADSTSYELAGSFLTPVLALQAESYLDDPVPVEPIDAPAYIRHMEIPMPSGVLVMADWFRIEGFNEGLETLCGADDYDINTSKGLDQRARDYFEKAGIAIVQVGNTSPRAITDTPGIWRMGFFDEDHEAFWTEAGEPSELAQPETPWSTCTDLWANTFADRETVISVLMASETYADRKAASDALDQYIDTTYGAHAIDLGVSSLHLYAPTGAGIHKSNFHALFTPEELDKPEWIEDYYVLSEGALTLSPDLLEETPWVAPCPDETEPTPEPGQA